MPIDDPRPLYRAGFRPLGSLAEAVGAREALREQPHEQSPGQADDVQVVALDPLDEARAEALDRVPAGATLPLAAREVVRDARAASSAGT